MKLYRNLLIGLLSVSLIGSTVYAEQKHKNNISLYSYVMETYSKPYKDTSYTVSKIEDLQEEYNLAVFNNLRAESFDYVKSYAEDIEQEINTRIDYEVSLAQTAQEEIASKIEYGLEDLTLKELSILSREYSKYKENIDELLADKTSLVSLFGNPMYDKIDVSELETSIDEQSNLVSYSTTLDDSVSYMGELSKLRRPFDGNVVVTSPAGYRIDPINGKTLFHNAVDYAMPVGTNLYSVFNGTVIRSDNNGDGYGENIKIDCGNGIILHYAHLSERYVKVGDTVTQNQLIGKSGNTGRSTGPHLHMGIYYKGEVLSIEELYK